MNAELTKLDFDYCEKKAKKMTDNQLDWSIRDAVAACAAMPDGHKARYYLDEAGVYSAELRKRRREFWN